MAVLAFVLAAVTVVGCLVPTEELEAVFFDKHLKSCKHCGKEFEYNGRKVYCSESCRKEAQRIMNAARVRKHREKKEGER